MKHPYVEQLKQEKRVAKAALKTLRYQVKLTGSRKATVNSSTSVYLILLELEMEMSVLIQKLELRFPDLKLNTNNQKL